jgi:hypothetical protein
MKHDRNYKTNSSLNMTQNTKSIVHKTLHKILKQ